MVDWQPDDVRTPFGDSDIVEDIKSQKLINEYYDEVNRAMDDLDCTCRQNSSIRYNSGLLNYPCPIHGIVFATKKERLEMLEERLEMLEERVSKLERLCPEWEKS